MASRAKCAGAVLQWELILLRVLYIASGSAIELDYHLLLSRDLGYLSDEDYRRMGHYLLEVRRMLTALLQKVGADRFAANC